MIPVRARTFIALAALLAPLAAMPLAAGAQAAGAPAVDTRPVVAVLYFDNNSIGKDAADFNGVGRGMAQLLIDELAGSTGVRVVERERIQALLEEQNLTRAGSIDPATAVRLGRILGAHHMITGGFMNTGRQMVLTARSFSVATSEIEQSFRVQQAGDDVMALIDRMAREVKTTMKFPPAERRTSDAGAAAGAASGHAHHGQPAATQAGQQVAAGRASNTAGAGATGAAQPKLDLRTALLFSKALEAQDAGDRGRAVELYNQVLDKFPTLETARTNRDRLQASTE